MAYHYTAKVQDLSPAEIAWWKDQLQPVVVTEGGHEYPNEQAVPAGESIEYEGLRGLRSLRDWSGAPDDPAIEVTVDENAALITDNEDESGTGLEAAGHLLAQFFAGFRPKDCLAFTFAFHELEDEEHGEHGGGVVVVSRRGARFPSMTEFAAAIRTEELEMLRSATST